MFLHGDLCSIPLINMQHDFFQGKKLTFVPTPGIEGVCKDRIYACMVLYDPFPLI